MHYANGREAKVGDQVIGRTYNQPQIIAGVLVSLTPGPDNCSAQVEFERAIILEKDETAEAAMMRMGTVFMLTAPGEMTLRRTQQHGQAGPVAAIVRCRDFTHAGNLFHAEDAHADAHPATAPVA